MRNSLSSDYVKKRVISKVFEEPMDTTEQIFMVAANDQKRQESFAKSDFVFDHQKDMNIPNNNVAD